MAFTQTSKPNKWSRPVTSSSKSFKLTAFPEALRYVQLTQYLSIIFCNG